MIWIGGDKNKVNKMHIHDFKAPQKQAQNDFALFGGVKLAADRIGRKNRVIEKAAGTPEAGVYPCRFYCN